MLLFETIFKRIERTRERCTAIIHVLFVGSQRPASALNNVLRMPLQRISFRIELRFGCHASRLIEFRQLKICSCVLRVSFQSTIARISQSYALENRSTLRRNLWWNSSFDWRRIDLNSRATRDIGRLERGGTWCAGRREIRDWLRRRRGARLRLRRSRNVGY